MEVPFARPHMDEAEIAAVAEVIRSGWVTQGPKVAEFEQAVAAFVGAAHGIATTSCSTALHLSLSLSGVDPGSEVLMPSFTCPATANAVCHAALTPVFVEIDPRTYNLDPEAVAAAIGARTGAILAVHQYGLPAEMEPLAALARRHHLTLIEDAALALGAAYQGKRIGSLGAPSCFSFHGRKIITTGEGGMVTTNDPAFAERARVVRSHGASVSDLARHHAKGMLIQSYEQLGYNFRMTDIQAAVGLAQMQKLPAILARRASLARRYDEVLAGMPELETPYVPPHVVHSYQTYLVRLTPRCRLALPEFMQAMSARGVPCRHSLTCHTEPFFRQLCGALSLPITEAAARTTVALPLYPTMPDPEHDYVVETLKAVLAQR